MFSSFLKNVGAAPSCPEPSRRVGCKGAGLLFHQAPAARQKLAQCVSTGNKVRKIQSAVGATDIFLRANPEPTRMASAAKNHTPEYQPPHSLTKSPPSQSPLTLPHPND